MAGEVTADSGGSGINVVLEENDIEGATLNEPLEAHTIPKLRWWLICHGRDAPSSEKKPGIIER